MQIFVNLITRAIFMSTPLVLGALGEVLAERTGMMVTAIEGIFLVGASVSYTHLTLPTTPYV